MSNAAALRTRFSAVGLEHLTAITEHGLDLFAVDSDLLLGVDADGRHGGNGIRPGHSLAAIRPGRCGRLGGWLLGGRCHCKVGLGNLVTRLLEVAALHFAHRSARHTACAHTLAELQRSLCIADNSSMCSLRAVPGQRPMSWRGCGAMRSILRVVAALPLAGSGDADVVALGELSAGVLGRPHLRPRAGRRSSNGVNLTHSDCSGLNDSITSRINWRARNNGQLRTGT